MKSNARLAGLTLGALICVIRSVAFGADDSSHEGGTAPPARDEATMSYMAYTKGDKPDPMRPITKLHENVAMFIRSTH